MNDIEKMIADMTAIRKANETIITIRRNQDGIDYTLNPISVRIARAGGSGQKSSDGTSQMQMTSILIADPDADIQIGDRFNDTNNNLYKVTLVRPNRLARLEAELELVS